MTTNELIIRLSEVIRRDERHRDYKRVNELSELYKKLITGEGMASLLFQFTPRESEELFKQRLRLTQHITKTVSQNVMDIFYKVPRANSVKRQIGYEDNDTARLKELNWLLSEFWGDQSLDDYMNMRWFEMNFTDPNTFVVVEWKDFDNNEERAQPYPFEVDCKAAVQFEFKNNDLVYLVAEQETKKLVWDRKKLKDVEVETETYTIYGENETIKFVELQEEEARAVMNTYNMDISSGEFIVGTTVVNGRIVSGYFVEEPKRKSDVYRIEVYTPHNLGYVPSKRVGFKRDLATNGRTFVSPLDKATPILMKMVKANSEFDLTMALHTFPQKIQYSARCKAQDCRDGTTAEGGICEHCHGSGYEIITSAQDAITIAMPKNKEEMIQLDNVIRYEYPPVDLVKFQEEYINSLTKYVKEAVFNTELFSKKEVSETATGKNISLQNVYDSLWPVASAYSKVWNFLVTTVADVTDLDKGLVAFYNFSKDFKLKSLSDLYMDLKMVGDARASEFVKSAIESDIASIIYSEDERALMKYNVQQSFYPFSGKTPEQVNIVTQGSDVTQFTKVFYANFGYVFDEIEREQAGVDFYYLARDKQWALIEKKVNEIIVEVDADAPEEPVIAPIEKTPAEPTV